MSRIGKKPIPMPAKVEAQIAVEQVKVKGPKGELKVDLPEGISVEKKDSVLHVVRRDNTLAAKHGLIRSLLVNAVTGVSTGFTKELEIVGIGYRAEVKGKVVSFALGFSHPVVIDAPAGITFEVPAQTKIIVKGADKEVVGQVAASIRKIRKPEPYKGKGVRYLGEKVLRKAGKASK